VEVATSDQSFLAEDHLKDLFSALDMAGVHVRMMQQHATHFGLVTDRDNIRLQTLQKLLGRAFQMRCEEGLLLLTVRHGDAAVVRELTSGREVVVEQVAGVTTRRLMRN
jgi:aspartate kinase